MNMLPPSSPFRGADRRTDSISVTQERQDCLENGYQPIEIMPGTKGDAEGGSGLRKKFTQFRGLPRFWSRYSSTSLLCEGMRVFDLDIDDPAMLQKVLPIVNACGIDLLGTIHRTRPGASRGVFLFRALKVDGAWPRKRRLVLTGESNAIDILAAGQQFVAFGPHVSGQPYIWPVGSPRTRPYDTLPIVTDGHIDLLTTRLDNAGLLVKTNRNKEPSLEDLQLTDWDGNVVALPAEFVEMQQARRAHGLPTLTDNFSAGVRDNQRLTVAAAELILLAMPNNFPPGHLLHLSYEEWRDIAFACHDVIRGEARARGTTGPTPDRYWADNARLFEAFRLFSEQYQDKPDANAGIAIEKLWDSTRGEGAVTTGTLLYELRRRLPDFVIPYEEEES